MRKDRCLIVFLFRTATVFLHAITPNHIPPFTHTIDYVDYYLFTVCHPEKLIYDKDHNVKNVSALFLRLFLYLCPGKSNW